MVGGFFLYLFDILSDKQSKIQYNKTWRGVKQQVDEQKRELLGLEADLVTMHGQSSKPPGGQTDESPGKVWQAKTAVTEAIEGEPPPS